MLSLAMNNDPLRSSISIIIMIMISVLINCIHFAVTVLHMHTDSVRGGSMQDLNTAEGLTEPERERGSVWSGITECKIAETLASAETCRIWLISQKTSAIKELATVGRPEYTPLYNLSLRMKWRQRRKAKTVPVWSSSSRELRDLRLHRGHDLT